MTNQEIMRIALRQSAYDCNCEPEDFLSETNKIVLSQKNEKARTYLPLPFECDLVFLWQRDRRAGQPAHEGRGRMVYRQI